MTALELWGGVECTLNRVHDAFHSQLRASGHERRSDDLDRFARLGIRRLRYPVLWELTAPDAPGEYDWSWADERLQRLRELSIAPIVGLIHHGSGPRYTNLLDERFPEQLAAYAGAVAARFPWASQYTPVNEPLTTARFSALYGHWYPHRSDDRSFVRAVLNQCRATVLAMRAIRDVNSEAQLVQTDDLGKTYSTAPLAYQASFDNERRWLAWDLLCGRVDREHAMWCYLTGCGIAPAELAWFAERPCPPGIVGINHYVTSNRFLHHEVERFPPASRGGNGRDVYADVEAVRVMPARSNAVADLMQETWSRYRLPLAITEVHLGCTREEQLRWLYEIWLAARAARQEGIDVRAVTGWALLGSFDWNSLLTRLEGYYEPGAFDLRGTTPRPTALAHLMKELAVGAEPERSALLAEPGWWHRPARLFAPPDARPGPCTGSCIEAIGKAPASARPILVTGATGTLGGAFARVCGARGLATRVCSRGELDICERASIERVLDEIRPWAVVNTAGYVRVDDAERECERCYRENSGGAALLAAACAERGLPFVTFSSDLVFDGERSSPYVETHDVRPINVYGLSKARAEQAVMQVHPAALIVRTSCFFGPWDEHNFVTLALRTLAGGRSFTAIDDVVVSPTYMPDLVNASLDLLIDGERGLWHLVNDGSVTWAELAYQAARLARVNTAHLAADSWRSFGLAAPRPSFSALTSERGLIMPALDDALARYVAATPIAA